jgi:hypothetical protein
MDLSCGIGIKEKWQAKGMCQLQNFKQNNLERPIPIAILWRNFGRGKRAQNVHIRKRV